MSNSIRKKESVAGAVVSHETIESVIGRKLDGAGRRVPLGVHDYFCNASIGVEGSGEKEEKEASGPSCSDPKGE